MFNRLPKIVYYLLYSRARYGLYDLIYGIPLVSDVVFCIVFLFEKILVNFSPYCLQTIKKEVNGRVSFITIDLY